MMAAEIESFNIVKIKKGPNKGNDMCFVTATDSTGCCDSVIFFTEQLTLYRNELLEGNIVIIQGKTSKNGGLVVDKIYKPRG
jgi:DNA polymerase III alpha subunit